MEKEETANINPIRRKYHRTISPIRIPSNHTTPEEDKIPVKIWTRPKTTSAGPLVHIMASKPKRIPTDEITRDVVPLVPVIVMPLAERSRLED